MKMSTMGRYGLRAMIALAVNTNTKHHVPLKEIAKRENISESYLEQIFSSLKKAGLVKSIRGANGGYMINGSADSIYIKDILEALEGDLELVSQESANGDTIKELLYEIVWSRVNNTFSETVESMTLGWLTEMSVLCDYPQSRCISE